MRYVLGTESGPPHNIRWPDDGEKRGEEGECVYFQSMKTLTTSEG